jgi:DNA recombination protein RmuC
MGMFATLTTHSILMLMVGALAGLLLGWLIGAWQARGQARQWLDARQSDEQVRDQLKVEFEQLAARLLDEKGSALSAQSQASLNTLLQPFRQQIDQFQQRVNQIHDATVRGNTALELELRRVTEAGLRISTQAETLSRALKGEKKTAGNWGEMQLERTLQLAGLVSGDHYDAQPRFRDAAGAVRQPDFVVKLPDGKHMVIDSKVSLIDYEQAVAAQTDHERQAALDAHVRAVRAHIDDLARKDYSNLPGMHSPSFVFMFMPIEPAYIEALRHGRELFDYGFQRNVALVSHTTLLPVLKTVANVWMVARSNEQAHELSTRAGEIYNQVVMVAERLKRLGATLETVSRQYNDTVRSVAGQQGLHGKVQRFADLSAKANKTMPDFEPLQVDVETERLDVIAVDPEPDSERIKPAQD